MQNDAFPLRLRKEAVQQKQNAFHPERFRANWMPVRVKKTRQDNNLELRF
jgi:hypothetical protein